MSEEFLQFVMPCETCIVQAICVDKVKMKDKKIHKSMKSCLALPDWDEHKKGYIKGLFECLINISWDVIVNHANKEKSKEKPIGMPPQYVDMLIDIIATLQWMINSTSWEEGELYNFDATEIKSKLKNVTRWLTDGK